MKERQPISVDNSNYWGFDERAVYKVEKSGDNIIIGAGYYDYDAEAMVWSFDTTNDTYTYTQGSIVSSRPSNYGLISVTLNGTDITSQLTQQWRVFLFLLSDCYCPLGRICRSNSAGLLPKGRKNPTAVNISIWNAILRTVSPDTRSTRISNPTDPYTADKQKIL